MSGSRNKAPGSAGGYLPTGDPPTIHSVRDLPSKLQWRHNPSGGRVFWDQISFSALVRELLADSQILKSDLSAYRQRYRPERTGPSMARDTLCKIRDQ